MTKVCVKCKQIKKLTEYRKYSRGPREGQSYDYCNSCYSDYAAKAKAKRVESAEKNGTLRDSAERSRLKSLIVDALPKKPKVVKLDPKIPRLERVVKSH